MIGGHVLDDVHHLERETEADGARADGRELLLGETRNVIFEERREELPDRAGDEVAIALELIHVAQAQPAYAIGMTRVLAHAPRHLEHVRAQGRALRERERAIAAEHRPGAEA